MKSRSAILGLVQAKIRLRHYAFSTEQVMLPSARMPPVFEVVARLSVPG